MPQFSQLGSEPSSGNVQRQARENYKQVRHLNQSDLATRWRISPRTLERWRWIGEGPRYLKIGGRVVYRIGDIEAYEAEQLRLAEPETAGAATRRGRGA